jgi:hypothetical protein
MRTGAMKILRSLSIAAVLASFLLLSAFPAQAIRWPFGAGNQSLPLGNNYGEYQYYGGAPYLHPGIDILQPAGSPVYAVKSGIVKAVLTTSAEYHWRVAVGDSAGSGWCDGWLYAHLNLSTIQVQVGDSVHVGDYLGNIVSWPVAGFNHLHFVKIRNQGVTWASDWEFIANPLDELTPIDEPDPPLFENARPGAKFAFCYNNSHYYFDPGSPLSSQVDIVAKVSDKTNHPSWRLIPYRIDYSIFNDSVSFGPVLSFIFTDTLYWEDNVSAIYQNDGTCYTQGDYDYRDFFFIVTNTDGDSVVEASDFFLGWDTEQFPNASYWVKVDASDRYGNSSADSMQVVVENYFQVAGKVGLSDHPPDSSGTLVHVSQLGVSDTTVQSGAFQFDQVGGGYYDFQVSHPGYVPLDTVVQVRGGADYNFTLQADSFLRGDVNNDQQIDLADVIYLLNYLFKGGPTPSPFFSGDANSDDSVDISDAIYLLNYLFKQGPPPSSR